MHSGGSFCIVCRFPASYSQCEVGNFKIKPTTKTGVIKMAKIFSKKIKKGMAEIVKQYSGYNQRQTCADKLNEAGYTKTNGQPIDIKFVTNFKMRNRRLTHSPKKRNVTPVVKIEQTSNDKSILFDLVLNSKIDAETKIKVLKTLV